MFAVFRSLHMKLMLILLLLITSLMAVVGAFLTTSVSSFYIDTFYEQISAAVSVSGCTSSWQRACTWSPSSWTRMNS